MAGGTKIMLNSKFWAKYFKVYDVLDVKLDSNI